MMAVSFAMEGSISKLYPFNFQYVIVQRHVWMVVHVTMTVAPRDVSVLVALGEIYASSVNIQNNNWWLD